MGRIELIQPGDKVGHVGGVPYIKAAEPETRSAPTEFQGGELMKDAFLFGAVDALAELAGAYPETLAAALKYSTLWNLGIRPEERGYYPRLDKHQKALSKLTAEDEIEWEKRRTEDKLEPPKNKKEKKKRENDEKKAKEEVMRRMLKDMSVVNAYKSKVDSVINTAKEEQDDTGTLEKKACDVLGGGVETKKRVVEALHTWQAVSNVIEIPTDEELKLASICLEAENRSSKKWTYNDRRRWLMTELTERALGFIAQGGRVLSEIEEYWRLDELDLKSPNSGSTSLTEIVLLDISPFEVVEARGLGADRGDKHLVFGAQVVMSTDNAIFVKTLSKRDQITASTKDLEIDYLMVPDAAFLKMVMSGNFGGERFRKIIKGILGKPVEELTLPGNLVLGSTTQGEGSEATPIPVLNPELAMRILRGAKVAITELDKRKVQLASENPLLDVPAHLLPGEIRAFILRNVRELPNMNRVLAVVKKSVDRVGETATGPGSEVIDLVLNIELTRERAKEILFDDNKLKRKQIEDLYPEQGEGIMAMLENRAFRCFIFDKETATDWIDKRGEYIVALKTSNPDIWKSVVNKFDDLAKSYLKP